MAMINEISPYNSYQFGALTSRPVGTYTGAIEPKTYVPSEKTAVQPKEGLSYEGKSVSLQEGIDIVSDPKNQALLDAYNEVLTESGQVDIGAYSLLNADDVFKNSADGEYHPKYPELILNKAA